MHIFIDAGDGNILAFFELPAQKPMGRDENAPAWVQHLAFKVGNYQDLIDTKARLEAEGIEIGPAPVEAVNSSELSMPIEDLDLSVRSYNCLKREGVHTVGELVARTESDLLDIRNFGQKSIDEVKIKLHQLGLSLKDSPASFDPSEVAGYDVATGTWTGDAAYDSSYEADNDADYAETEQL